MDKRYAFYQLGGYVHVSKLNVKKVMAVFLKPDSFSIVVADAKKWKNKFLDLSKI